MKKEIPTSQNEWIFLDCEKFSLVDKIIFVLWGVCFCWYLLENCLRILTDAAWVGWKEAIIDWLKGRYPRLVCPVHAEFVSTYKHHIYIHICHICMYIYIYIHEIRLFGKGMLVPFFLQIGWFLTEMSVHFKATLPNGSWVWNLPKDNIRSYRSCEKLLLIFQLIAGP